MAYVKSNGNSIVETRKMMNSLFEAKLNLENSAEESHISCQIMMINWRLENELDIADHEQLFKDYKQLSNNNPSINPSVVFNIGASAIL